MTQRYNQFVVFLVILPDINHIIILNGINAWSLIITFIVWQSSLNNFISSVVSDGFAQLSRRIIKIIRLSDQDIKAKLPLLTINNGNWFLTSHT